MNEAEIRSHFIDPALDSSGWTRHYRRLEYSITAGRIVNHDGAWYRGEGSAADYILMPRADLHVGVVEAKDGSHTPDDGLQQALDYARLLDLPFALLRTAKRLFSTTKLVCCLMDKLKLCYL